MNFLRTRRISQQISQDDRLTTSHVSLYMALLIVWEQNSFANHLTISRKQLMVISKIGSFTTYHKCIKQLEEFGYIRYVPTFNSFIGTCVYILSDEFILPIVELNN